MTESYSLGFRVVHWLTAFLVLVQVTLAVLNIVFYEPRPVFAEWLVQAHISVGALILTLTLFRLGLRLAERVPAGSSNRGVRLASTGVHVLLYACLISLPISGYLRLAALGFEIRLFGAFTVPALDLNVTLARHAATLHQSTALLLGILLIMHISAAVFHRRLDGVSVLNRMVIRVFQF